MRIEKKKEEETCTLKYLNLTGFQMLPNFARNLCYIVI